MTSVAAIEGDTLDLICWRELGSHSGRLVERALELNPGLADQGSTLPVGTLVTLPELARPSGVPTLSLVQLWSSANG